MKIIKTTFWYRNSLSLVLVLLFTLSLIGQIYFGWQQYNFERAERDASFVPLRSYFCSGHFIQSTFENWESEFLQMAVYVVLTIFLRQIGSSESKSLDKREEVDRDPDGTRAGAPWPVKKGGIILKLYQCSLSVAFAILFVASFAMHAYGSFKDHNEQQQIAGKAMLSFSAYMGEPRFWFESFQNWQSEFISVAAIVVLSIFLRQKGSPESKPVDAPHFQG